MTGPSVSSLALIDWSQPWLDPWRERGLRVAQAALTGVALHEALNREQASPVRFVPQSEPETDAVSNVGV